VARLISGPFWGVLSDRVGRKLMFIRALYFATATTLIAAFATAPWHVAIAFACQGLFSGFFPAAVALTSVTVPEERLSTSLGMVTGAQYLGNTVGPAVGSGLAILFGLRGAILGAALMPAFAATMVLVAVPKDRVAPAPKVKGEVSQVSAPAPGMRSLLSGQFMLALLFYFYLFAVTQLVRLATPIALKDLEGHDSKGVVGLAFALGGIASVIGVMFIARRFGKPGTFRKVLAVACVLSGTAHILLAISPFMSLYVLWFVFISLAEGAMLPSSNALIAANVPRERRGTAFGLAGSAQALAFMVGPMSAAIFAAISLDLGFALLGLLFFGLGALILFALREPTLGLTPSE
jgi:DHA1 family multidrug resistance protein-like MFS transporter